MALADAAGSQRDRDLLAGGARGLERIGYTPGKHRIQPYWPIKHKHWATVPWHTMAGHHLGNNMEFHGDIYDLAIRTPGLLVIHDLALDDFVMGMVATAQPFGHQALREGLLLAPASTGSRRPNTTNRSASPTSRTPLGTREIVVHSPFVERYLRAFGCKTLDLCGAAPGHRDGAGRPQGRGRARAIRGSLESMGMRTLVACSATRTPPS